MELTRQVEVLLPSKESSISHTCKFTWLKQDAARVHIQIHVICRAATSLEQSNYGMTRLKHSDSIHELKCCPNSKLFPFAPKQLVSFGVHIKETKNKHSRHGNRDPWEWWIFEANQ